MSQYLFGVELPEFYGLVDIQNVEGVLFMPRLPQHYAVWEGKIHPTEWYANSVSVEGRREIMVFILICRYKERFGVDRVLYADEIDSVCCALALVFVTPQSHTYTFASPGSF